MEAVSEKAPPGAKNMLRIEPAPRFARARNKKPRGQPAKNRESRSSSWSIKAGLRGNRACGAFRDGISTRPPP